MKITNKLPQFENETALLVITGKQDAVFYIAENGEIKQVETFKVDRPKYTDLEGHFESRAKGRTMKAGSPFEPTDVVDAAVRKFLKELEGELKSVSRHHQLTSLYVFCPSHIKNDIEKLVPSKLAKKEQRVIEGNFFDEHPFELLKKIQKQQSRNPIKPISEAARKILNKFKR